jgi:hypothetical protein
MRCRRADAIGAAGGREKGTGAASAFFDSTARGMAPSNDAITG